MSGKKKIGKIIFKIVMGILIAEIGCNFVMQTISYSFYKAAIENAIFVEGGKVTNG